MNDTSTAVALTSLVATLGGALTYLLRHVITKLIPDMQAAHATQLSALTDAFRRDTDRNRELSLQLHASNTNAISRIGQGLERVESALLQNQTSLLELISRVGTNGHHATWKPPMSECVLPVAPAVPGSQGPDDAA